MDTYVIGEEENYSDFIKELISEEPFIDKGEEVLLEEDRESKNVTIEDYWFLAK